MCPSSACSRIRKSATKPAQPYSPAAACVAFWSRRPDFADRAPAAPRAWFNVKSPSQHSLGYPRMPTESPRCSSSSVRRSRRSGSTRRRTTTAAGSTATTARSSRPAAAPPASPLPWCASASTPVAPCVRSWWLRAGGSGDLGALPHPGGRVVARWNGRDAAGKVVPDGSYRMKVSLSGRKIELLNPLTLDTSVAPARHQRIAPRDLAGLRLPRRPRDRRRAGGRAAVGRPARGAQGRRARADGASRSSRTCARGQLAAL